MKRNVGIEEISDGKFYGRNDMVRAGCGDCRGCSSCCHGMGESIILDPYDVWRLTVNLSVSMVELLNDERLALNVVDGVILPNLKMNPETESCGFLNEQGRCSIHPFRPGVCRLFPLGRYYHSGETEEESTAVGKSFQYFLQVHECPMPNKTKVKVSKWVDTPQLEKYEAYIAEWHYFLEEVEKHLAESDEDRTKNVNVFLLKVFFIAPYEASDFYPQFAARMKEAREALEF